MDPRCVNVINGEWVRAQRNRRVRLHSRLFKSHEKMRL